MFGMTAHPIMPSMSAIESGNFDQWGHVISASGVVEDWGEPGILIDGERRRFYTTRRTDKGYEHLLNDYTWSGSCHVAEGVNGWYRTREEAAFRLLLSANPAAAIAPFLSATGGVYDRDPHLLLVAADWMEERGMEMEAQALRSINP